MRLRLTLAAAAFIVGTLPAWAHAASYDFTHLGDLRTDWSSEANAISHNGLVAGSYRSIIEIVYVDPVSGSRSAYTTHDQASIWNVHQGGALTTLAAVPEAYNTRALSVNAAGVVAGIGTARSDDGLTTAIVWRNGEAQLLGTGVSARAISVNSEGNVIGTDAGSRATQWTRAGATHLGAVTTYGEAINDQGAVVVGTGAFRASLIDGGTTTRIGTPDFMVSVKSLNNVNQTAGYSIPTAEQGQANWNVHTRATVWDANGTATFLDQAGGYASQALGINDQGLVVGWIAPDFVGDFNVSSHRAVLWADGEAIFLDTLLDQADRDAGWKLLEARGINNLGQIVGVAGFNGTVDGQRLSGTFGFVLSPVPEASTLLQAGLGLCLMTVVLMRRRGGIASPVHGA